MGKLILKELKENYLYSAVISGSLLFLSLYATFTKVRRVEEYIGMSIIFLILAFAVLFLYAIYRGFNSLKREKDRNTLEFLLSLPLNGFELHISKFVAFLIEALGSALVLFIVSLIPSLRGIGIGVLTFKDFAVLLRFLVNLSLQLFLIALLIYLSFNFLETFFLSFKIKGFWLTAPIFLFFLYFTSKLFNLFSEVFSFLPVYYQKLELLGYSTIGANWDLGRLAAGVFLSLIYFTLSVLLQDKKLEV